MKKLFFITILLLSLTATTHGQTSYGFGLKGGLNYNANGNYFESASANAKHPDRNIGYHFGLFGKIGNEIYFKPELVYTRTKSDYDNNSFNMQKLDAPLLVGIKVLGPISAFAGPAFQYILDADFNGISINDVKNDFSVGLNFGFALNLKKVGIDLRYERGFSKNEANFIQANLGGSSQSRLDTRPDQLILGLSLIL